MATIKVEDYRRDVLNRVVRTDSEAIRLAIIDLKDGDTLMFSSSRTYALDKPADFTLCIEKNKETDEEVEVHKTRNRLTIDGCGCTVCGSSDFIRDFGGTGENNKNALFYISDNTKHGMKNCTIKNFIFKWNESGEANGVAIKDRNIGVGVITSTASNDTSTQAVYFSNGIIENCEFHNFRVGLYQCGDDSVVRGCKFQFCREGIYSDGSAHNVFENNNFLETYFAGIHMNISYDSTARNNKFHACQNYSIFVNGHYESSDESKDIRVSVIDNKIFGRYMDAYYLDEENYDNTKFVEDTGIRIYGMKKAIIRGNIVAGISRDRRLGGEHGDYGYGHGSGFGIELAGNDSEPKTKACFNEDIIVSDNCIYDCYGGGIKVDHSTMILICNNNITNSHDCGVEAKDNVGKIKKHGIQIKSNVHGVSVVNNRINCFNEGEQISIPGNTGGVVQNNIIIVKEFDKSNYLPAQA